MRHSVLLAYNCIVPKHITGKKIINTQGSYAALEISDTSTTTKTEKVKQRSKRTLFSRTKHDMPIFGASPFVSSYKTTLKQQLNDEVRDVELGHLLLWVELCCFRVQSDFFYCPHFESSKNVKSSLLRF